MCWDEWIIYDFGRELLLWDFYFAKWICESRHDFCVTYFFSGLIKDFLAIFAQTNYVDDFDLQDEDSWSLF